MPLAAAELMETRNSESMSELEKFVEGRVVGVSCDESLGIVRLALEDRSRRGHVLTAYQVDDLLVLDMRKQNIIDRVCVWDSNSDSAEWKRKLALLLYGELDAAERYSEYAKRIDEAAARINSRETILLEVEPVFGALILLLTKQFEIVAQ